MLLTSMIRHCSSVLQKYSSSILILLLRLLLLLLPPHHHYHHHHHPPPFYSLLSGTTQVSQYQTKLSFTDAFPDNQLFFNSFLRLLPSITLCSMSVLDSLFAQPLQILLSASVWHPPLRTPYISAPSHYFCKICPYHCNLFGCSTMIMSSKVSLFRLLTV